MMADRPIRVAIAEFVLIFGGPVSFGLAFYVREFMRLPLSVKIKGSRLQFLPLAPERKKRRRRACNLGGFDGCCGLKSALRASFGPFLEPLRPRICLKLVWFVRYEESFPDCRISAAGWGVGGTPGLGQRCRRKKVPPGKSHEAVRRETAKQPTFSPPFAPTD